MVKNYIFNSVGVTNIIIFTQSITNTKVILTFQFELLVLFDVEEPQWALSEDAVADCKEIFTLFDTDNVKLLITLNWQTVFNEF